MPTIGIIANPASGKDIRRLVSYATTIDNREKVNIVKRITLAAQSMGIDRILFMPDTFQIGRTVMSDLARDGLLEAELCVLDMPITASYEDTIRAAELMEAMGAGCCVVLGGDGTSRAAAKGLDETPILPVSTGTNNVYPTLTEGTVAGMAAAAAAILGPSENCRIRDKRIEISINGRFADIALVDAVITADLWVGAKAIWDTGKLRRVIATRCHPASIGFSSVAGCVGVVRDTDDFGVDAVLYPAKVAYREKIKKKVEAHGRHKKQTGGSGQFGDVWIRFEPQEEQDDMIFAEEVFGGSVPKNFYPAVEKGIQEAVQKGPLAGYPMVGLKATLYDGSYHPVDSNEMAFKLAAILAFKEAMPNANPTLLEPIGALTVTVPDSYVGDVMGDLSKRRGRPMGMSPDHEGNTVIEAEVPMAEMSSYAIDLRAMTQARGSFTLEFVRYEEVPKANQAKIIADAKAND